MPRASSNTSTFKRLSTNISKKVPSSLKGGRTQQPGARARSGSRGGEEGSGTGAASATPVADRLASMNTGMWLCGKYVDAKVSGKDPAPLILHLCVLNTRVI